MAPSLESVPIVLISSDNVRFPVDKDVAELSPVVMKQVKCTSIVRFLIVSR